MSRKIALLIKATAVLLALNEIRGLILAGPVIYALYRSGGSLMAIWLAASSMGGIILSVLVPLIVSRKLGLHARPLSATISRVR